MPEPAAGTQNAGASAAPSGRAADPRVISIIAKYGSAENAVYVLARENKKYRDAAKGGKVEMDQDLVNENADLLRENARLLTLVPAEGSVVLTGDKAKEYEAYQALGPVKEVKEKVERLDNVEKELADTTARTLHAEAATALGWNDEALTKFAKTEGVHIEMKDGKPVARKADDAKSVLEPLNEFVEKNHKLYQPMLLAPKVAAEGAGNNGAGSSKTTTSTRPGSSTTSRAPMPRMGGASTGSTGGAGGASVLDAHRARQTQQRNSAVNPLATRPAVSAADAK